MVSFENIIGAIHDYNKKSMQGQVTMFDIGNDSNNGNKELKYTFNVMKEYEDKELLAMEKEMLGIYLSGHPLEKLKDEIERKTNINSLEIHHLNDEITNGEAVKYKDGDIVKYAGILSNVKKRYTKTNKLMFTADLEDLYGIVDILVFENGYINAANYMIDDNIVIVEGRLSIREDEEPKIVVRNIKTLREVRGENRPKILTFDITNLDENRKSKLRSAIRFCAGNHNNILIQVKDGDVIKPCGAIYLTEERLNKFKEILGSERCIW